MNRSAEPATRARLRRSTLHASKVDRRSIIVNTERTTGPLLQVQPCEDMGDARHKKPPPKGESEIVTDEFREDVRVLLAANKMRNKRLKLKPGADGYMPGNQAQLGKAIGTSTRMVSRIIGAAKPGSEIDLVTESVYLAPIRAVLGMTPPEYETIKVLSSRASIVRLIAELPDDLFRAFELEAPQVAEVARQRSAK